VLVATPSVLNLNDKAIVANLTNEANVANKAYEANKADEAKADEANEAL
jgi:hypothetical protein